MKLSAWTMLVALLIGVAGGALLCPDVLDSVSREIITALSIQAGAMMTTMIFTAGLAKNDSLSPKRTEEVSNKLRGILIFLISVFLLFFLFIASQAKKYFEEQYILSTRSHYLLKQMQRRQDTGSGT